MNKIQLINALDAAIEHRIAIALADADVIQITPEVYARRQETYQTYLRQIAAEIQYRD